MHVRIHVVILVGALVSGCLGAPQEAPPEPTAQGPSDPCDVRVEAERIRSREVDLASDPNDRQRLAAGFMASIPSTRDSPPDDEPVWIRVVRSDDGGTTWTGADLPGSPGSSDATSPFFGSAVTGDPVMAFLPDGTLLMSGIMIRADGYGYWMFSARFEQDSLSPTDVVVFSKGAYGDASLNQVTSPGTVLYNDKQEMAVDPDTGIAYVSWMWRHNDPADGIQSVPVVVMSSDGGKSWTPPKMVLGGLGGGLTHEEGNIGQFPFITSDGQAHIVWYAQRAQSLLVSSAPVGTLDFGEPRTIVTGVVLDSDAQAITLPLPSAAVGPGPDGVGESAYVAWADSRSGDADILVVRSDDGAQTWSEPVSVTAANLTASGRDQLVPVVAVSDTGTLGAHFIEFSEDSQAYDAYAALSTDGARSFVVRRISSESTRIMEATGQRGTGIQGHVGDYFGAAFTDVSFVAMWQDGRDGSEAEPFTTAYACRLAAP